MTATADGERVQKVLARLGLGSRREIEGWIAGGRVSLGGRLATLGDRVGPHDRIELDGRPVRATRPVRSRVLLYHKPEGEICTRRDGDGRPTVFDGLPSLDIGRWIAIGRLDVMTSGLLLFTTEGELAHRLMHPSTGVEREYAVRVLGEVDGSMIRRLLDGVDLDGERARFRALRAVGGEGANRWFHVVLDEGRNREVHRLWETQGVRVSRLKRIRYGPVRLERGLRPGRHAMLPPRALRDLRAAAGLPAEALSRPHPASKTSFKRSSMRRLYRR